jgi:hypothetical protein
MKNIFQEFKEIVSGAIAIVVDKIFRKDQQEIKKGVSWIYDTPFFISKS